MCYKEKWLHVLLYGSKIMKLFKFSFKVRFSSLRISFEMHRLLLFLFFVLFGCHMLYDCLFMPVFVLNSIMIHIDFFFYSSVCVCEIWFQSFPPPASAPEGHFLSLLSLPLPPPIPLTRFGHLPGPTVIILMSTDSLKSIWLQHQLACTHTHTVMHSWLHTHTYSYRRPSLNGHMCSQRGGGVVWTTVLESLYTELLCNISNADH